MDKLRIKYPRTYHLPWSRGMSCDDKMMTNIDSLIGKRVIVTEKMDGENTTMYSDHIHARAVDSANHESRNWVKNFWSNFSFEIPKDWRVCGENMFAVHSIKYSELDSYFYGFSIWNDKNECLSWDDTLKWFNIIYPDIKTVPVLYDGIFDVDIIQDLWNDSMYAEHEGYVLRLADSFSMSKFRTSAGKFVRNNHVQTAKHWMHGQRMVVNKLKK